jgi:hypothetical protein
MPQDSSNQLAAPQLLSKCSTRHGHTRSGTAVKVRVASEFVGVVNGVPVRIMGRGHLDPPGSAGNRALDIEFVTDIAPFGFDCALLALGPLDVALSPCPPLGVEVQALLRWSLFDENHRDMGGFELASTISFDEGGITIRGQFVEARTRMEPTERAVTLADGYPCSAISIEDEAAVLTSAGRFETTFGNGYRFVAVTMVWGAEVVVPARIVRVGVERAAERATTHRLELD